MTSTKSDLFDTIAVCAPDNTGRLIGKRLPAARWQEVLADGMPMPNFHLVTGIENEPYTNMEVTGYRTGFCNGLLFPVDQNPRPFALEDGVGLALANVHDMEGCRVAVSPRQILIHQLERLEERGISATCATELEFYLFRTSYRGAHDGAYADLVPYHHFHGDNDILVSGFAEPFLSDLRRAAENMGLQTVATQGEGGPGQFEINFHHASPLKAADDHVIFKHLAKRLAYQHDLSVTFMAKIDPALPGSSCHIHFSICDPKGSPVSGTREHGLSDTGRAFLAGLVDNTNDFMPLFCPYLNSYRRLQPESFAPSNCTWGMDNRSVMIRIVGDETLRFEFRLPGADSNPYWAISGLIAAGLAGLQQDAELCEPVIGNAYATSAKAVPGDLSEAVDAFASSQIAASAFTTEVHQHLLGLARRERDAGRKMVTSWELKRGFERA